MSHVLGFPIPTTFAEYQFYGTAAVSTGSTGKIPILIFFQMVRNNTIVLIFFISIPNYIVDKNYGPLYILQQRSILNKDY